MAVHSSMSVHVEGAPVQLTPGSTRHIAMQPSSGIMPLSSQVSTLSIALSPHTYKLPSFSVCHSTACVAPRGACQARPRPLRGDDSSDRLERVLLRRERALLRLELVLLRRDELLVWLELVLLRRELVLLRRDE